MLEIARGGLLRAGMGARFIDVAAVLNVQSDHLGLAGHRYAGAAGRRQADPVEVAKDTAVLNADDPLVPPDGRLHRGQARLLRHHEPRPLAGAGAHPGRRARRVLEARHQRPDDHDLRSRRPHPAALDPPHPGNAGGPGDPQRAECDVRRRPGLQHGGQAGGHPARPADLRHHLLPGPGPDERVRRAAVQGDRGLRPQRQRPSR